MNLIVGLIIGYLGIGTILSIIMALSYKYGKKTKKSLDDYMDESFLNKELIPIFIISYILLWGMVVKVLIRNK